MKNKAIVLTTLILGLFVVTGCGQNTTNSDSPTLKVPVPENKDVEEMVVVDEGQTEEPTRTEEVAPSGEKTKEFDITARNWEFIPNTITVNKGDTVKLKITSIQGTHGFMLSEFGINTQLVQGNTVNVEFVADKVGTFKFACYVQCGRGHGGMKGQLIVK